MSLACSCFEIMHITVVGRSLDLVCILLLCGDLFRLTNLTIGGKLSIKCLTCYFKPMCT